VDLVTLGENVLRVEVVLLFWHLEASQTVVSSTRTPIALAHLTRPDELVEFSLLLNVPEMVGNHDLLEQRKNQAIASLGLGHVKQEASWLYPPDKLGHASASGSYKATKHFNT
jgi:hypothetical protein